MNGKHMLFIHTWITHKRSFQLNLSRMFKKRLMITCPTLSFITIIKTTEYFDMICIGMVYMKAK